MKNQMMLVTAVLVIIVGAGGFFAGMQYQKSQRPSFMAGQMGMGRAMFGMRNGMGRMGMGGAVVGEILSMDEKSITVKLADGSSKIVLLPESAIFSKTDTGAKSDLKVGTRVGVFGSNNADGSVTAANVQINPMFRGPTPSSSPK